MFVLMWVRLNYGNAQEQQVMGIINGEFSFKYWGLTFLVGILAPLALTGIKAVRGNPVVVAVAGVLALIGAYTYRDIIMLAGQLPQLYY